MKEKIVFSSPSTLGLLGVAFIVLKLLHVINWSWWWVVAPFWIPAIFIIIYLALIMMILIHKW